jgi:protein ImuB
MRRLLCVWFPTFQTDLFQRRLRRMQACGPQVEGPSRGFSCRHVLLLTRRVASRDIVQARCTRAARAGMRIGMDLAQARAMTPRGHGVVHEPARLRRDAGSLRSLAAWALRFSPTVMPVMTEIARGNGGRYAVQTDYGLAMDLTGMQRVHGDEGALLARVARVFGRMGFAARVASASTLACAWAVARFGDAARAMVRAGGERAVMEPLAIDCLDPDLATLESLAAVGVTRVQHLLALSRSEIAARYPMGLLERLDRAVGRRQEPPLDGVRAFEPIVGEFVFEGPTDRFEALLAGAGVALDRLLDVLARCQRAVRTLAVRIQRPQGPADQFEIPFARPSVHRAHIARMLWTRLERVDLSQPVDAVRLRAARTARLRHVQAVASGPAGTWIDASQLGEQGPAELLDALVARLGRDRVLRARLCWSHLPERIVRFESVLDGGDASGEEGVDGDVYGGESTELASRLGAMDRPSILWFKPLATRAVALHPDGPVARIRFQGKDHGVIACIGPHRVSPEWWRWEPGGASPVDRDYYRVQLDDGRWILACRTARGGESGWVVQGVWG